MDEPLDGWSFDKAYMPQVRHTIKSYKSPQTENLRKRKKKISLRKHFSAIDGGVIPDLSYKHFNKSFGSCQQI